MLFRSRGSSSEVEAGGPWVGERGQGGEGVRAGGRTAPEGAAVPVGPETAPCVGYAGVVDRTVIHHLHPNSETKRNKNTSTS